MSNIITNTEVFDFMGTPSDVRTQQGDSITILITTMQDEIERNTGRKVIPTAFTDALFQQGLNCFIKDNLLFLQAEFRDIYSITTILEDGIALTAGTDSDATGDYFLDWRKGILIKIDSNWSLENLAIKITGSLGIVDDPTADSPASRSDIKQALKEMVAAKSGLWKNNVETEDGSIEVIRTKISEDAKEIIKKYRLRDF